jgi:hypothetical protein
MNKRVKLLDAMRNNPRDWRIADLLSVSSHYGMQCRSYGGSHYIFSYPGVDFDLSVPAHRPIKPVYIRQFIALIDRIKDLH